MDTSAHIMQKMRTAMNLVERLRREDPPTPYSGEPRLRIHPEDLALMRKHDQRQRDRVNVPITHWRNMRLVLDRNVARLMLNLSVSAEKSPAKA